jgi:hypothetical protein
MKKALAAELSHVPHVVQQSTSRWFEFETEVLSQDENLDGLNQINRDVLAKIESMDSRQWAVLDIDTATPACGEQEHSAQFNGEGDGLAANLRPENVPSSEDCDKALLLEVERQQERSKEVVVRGDAAFAKPEIYEVLEKRGVMQKLPGDRRSVPEPPNEHAIYQGCAAVMGAARELPALSQPAGVATTATRRLKHLHLHKRSMAAAAVATAFMIACWIAYTNRAPASPLGKALQKSNALEQQVPLVSAKQLAADSTTKSETVPTATEEPRAARSRHRRVQVGENQVDIGDDVTVHYFTPQHAVAPPQPVESAGQPADR